MESRVCVLFDGTPEAWAEHGASALQDALVAVVFAANTHAASAASATTTLRLFSQTSSWNVGPLNAQCGRPLSAAETQKALQSAVLEDSVGSTGSDDACVKPGGLATMLSRALCIENSASRPGALLLVLPSQLAPLRYVPLMNCAFAAARLHIPVDVVLVHAARDASAPEAADRSGRHGLLHQIASIAGGMFYRVSDAEAMVTTLGLFFGVESSARRSLALPAGAATRDLRPSCFCHGRTVSRGFVCSVCLSVFCAFSPVCATCRTKVDFRSAR